MEPLKTRSHQVLERVENMPHKVHCSFAKMSGDEKGKCNTIYRLYACLKAICNVKRSIGNLFFRSSFSERMIQVASTGEKVGTPWEAAGRANEALLARFSLHKSMQGASPRDANPRQPAWKADGRKIAACFL